MSALRTKLPASANSFGIQHVSFGTRFGNQRVCFGKQTVSFGTALFCRRDQRLNEQDRKQAVAVAARAAGCDPKTAEAARNVWLLKWLVAFNHTAMR